MIVYLAARLVALFYGCDWPITGEAKFFCVFFSWCEIVGVSVLSIGSFVQWLATRKGGRHG